MGEIGEVRMCKRILKEQTADTGEIPFYKIGTFGKEANAFISRELFNEYKSKYSYPKKGNILISASGTIGRTVIFDGKDAYFQDSNIVWIENNESVVLDKFLFYLYQVIKWNIAEGGTIQRLYNDNLKKIKIPIPHIEEQKRIVDILDKFDTLTNSISEGLPKEIELRNKQYEYYREMLLGFERV
ncbi:restriction endonuclease subunit S [Gallibacterium genomosp. 3]|uniref:Restriction endonuclease subunit S n=2 Tax=Gallibacterium genomosp. 3 TaxID=505345 RepID=A0A1A7PVV9_9PAST|nr:restriction endonuclease subunit S [Gallibacterium genomosp. 3]